MGAGSSSAAVQAVSRVGRFAFRFRDYLAPAGLVLILVFSRPLAPFGSEEADRWLDLFGFLVASLGQAIRATCIGFAYIVRGGVGKSLAAPKLVCEGLYAHSRNPMYLGNFLLLAGIAIIYNNPLVYLIGLPLYYGGILSIIKAEEEFLRGKFGQEYDDYCASVPRFFPKLPGLGRTFQSMHFDWRRVLRKEYGTTFAWLSVSLLLVAWERVSRLGLDAARPTLIRAAVAFVMVFAAWFGVRRLKKRGLLDTPENV
jgi:protein-S-isoprenylcysteine O-methyltransferase Ste14